MRAGHVDDSMPMLAFHDLSLAVDHVGYQSLTVKSNAWPACHNPLQKGDSTMKDVQDLRNLSRRAILSA